MSRRPAQLQRLSGAQAGVNLLKRTIETCKAVLQIWRTPPRLLKIAMTKLIGGRDHRSTHRSVFMRPLRPGQRPRAIDPNGKSQRYFSFQAPISRRRKISSPT
jgi:hypothetical protein